MADTIIMLALLISFLLISWLKLHISISLALAGLLIYFTSISARPRPRLPPGPPSLSPFLTFLKMIPQKPRFRWILSLAAGNDITCIPIATTKMIIVNSPELARQFLVKHDASFASRPISMGSAYASRGYLSLATVPWGDQWVKMRKVVVCELLSPNRLKWQDELRVEEADHLMRYLCSLSTVASSTSRHRTRTWSVINVRHVVYYYTSNVIRRMLFGRRHFGIGGSNGGPGPEEIAHVAATFTVLDNLYSFCVSDFVPCLRWFDLDGHERAIKEAIRVIGKYHDPIIEERVRKWRDGHEDMGEEEDLVYVMARLKTGTGEPLLTVEEIKAQSAELLYATIDNVSNIVEWALAEMLNQPEILNKAVEELDQVVGPNRLVQESDFPHLSYVKACAREVVRLHPVAPFNVPHVATCDVTVANYYIPEGSQVLLSRVGLGRNPKIWADPLTFNPDRHLSTDDPLKLDLADPELRFISFTTGRRGCKGVQLGSLMTFMLLARMLHGFEWRLPPEETRVDLSEEKKSLFLAKPLHACVNPRIAMLDHL